jgi:hypothetical protein
MFVCCVCLCCQVEVSATSWSLVQRSPTDCGVSLCVIKKPRDRGGHSPRWAAETEKKNGFCEHSTFPQLYIRSEILMASKHRRGPGWKSYGQLQNRGLTLSNHVLQWWAVSFTSRQHYPRCHLNSRTEWTPCLSGRVNNHRRPSAGSQLYYRVLHNFKAPYLITIMQKVKGSLLQTAWKWIRIHSFQRPSAACYWLTSSELCSFKRHFTKNEMTSANTQLTSRNSVFGRVTMLRAERYGVLIQEGAENLLFCKTPRSTNRPTQPPNQRVPGFFPGG